MIGKPTYKTEVDKQLAELGKPFGSEYVIDNVFIPENSLDIRPGYYDNRALVSLLRSIAGNSNCRRRIQFLVDMME